MGRIGFAAVASFFCISENIKYKYTMKQKSGTNRQNPAERYISPATKVIAVNAVHIICGSERQNMLNSTEMEAGDDNW